MRPLRRIARAAALLVARGAAHALALLADADDEEEDDRPPPPGFPAVTVGEEGRAMVEEAARANSSSRAPEPEEARPLAGSLRDRMMRERRGAGR